MNGERYLPARILQLVGLALLVGAAIFWAVTGRESTLLVGAAMSLTLLVAYGKAIESLKRRDEPPTPPPAVREDDSS